MPAGPDINKYFLSRPKDEVAVALTANKGNSVVAQLVTGDSAVAQVEVSLDLGHSWSPIALTNMATGELIRAIRKGPPAWAMVPGVTNAKVVLIENPSGEECKVNLRYGRI